MLLANPPSAHFPFLHQLLYKDILQKMQSVAESMYSAQQRRFGTSAPYLRLAQALQTAAVMLTEEKKQDLEKDSGNNVAGEKNIAKKREVR